ncbi:MAG: SDR family NAD(P)-dependent oxidoreductase [Thermodesulfovibrionales bacterium]
MKLEGKVAVITGAATGIGFETARLFFQEGASVVGLYHKRFDEKKIEDTFMNSVKVLYLQADVTKPSEIKDVASKVENRFNRVDILVNNAAVDMIGNIEETSEKEFLHIMKVNVFGTFVVTKYFLPLMKKEKKGGSIINIASSIGLMGMARRLAYTTSKGAVVNFTRSMAMDFVDYNIRVNAIAPGGTYTEMVAEFFKKHASEEFKKEVYKMHVLNRLAEPIEIAKPILFLASGESSFVNGAIFSVDGGYICGK